MQRTGAAGIIPVVRKLPAAAPAADRHYVIPHMAVAMESQRYVIRDSGLWNGPDNLVQAKSPPYLIVTATTEELSSSGRVAGQLQVSIANGDPDSFPVGRVITIAVE